MQTEYTKPRAVGFLSAHAVGEFAGHDWRQATSYTEVDTTTSARPSLFCGSISVSRCKLGNEESNTSIEMSNFPRASRPPAGIKLNFRVKTSVRDGTKNRERRHILISGQLSRFQKCSHRCQCTHSMYSILSLPLSVF